MNGETTFLSKRNLSMALALGGVFGFFALASPQFLSARNLSMLVIELSITATLALGTLPIILAGQIDLSIGSGVGLIGGIASVLVFRQHWPAVAALGMGFLVAVALWFSMGAMVVKQRMPSFIITLGGLLVFKGLFWLVIRNATVPVVAGGASNLYSLLTTFYLPHWAGYAAAAAVATVLGGSRLRARRRRRSLGLAQDDGESDFLKWFVSAQLLFLFALVMNVYRGVPLSALILAAVFWGMLVLTEHTRYGRYLYAIGGNPEAAVVSGIPSDAVVIGAFALMGAVVAITGFMQTAYAGASTTTVGDLMELDAIAACVIGGTSLMGGRGTAYGVLFGALIMAGLLNGMTLMAVSPELKLIARGAVLALAVWLDVRLSASEGR